MANMLDASYLTDPPEDDEKPGEEPEAPETPAEGEEPAQAAKPKLTPITRRQRAKERDESLLKEIASTREMLQKAEETQRERFDRLERENAELRGHVQGLASRPAPEARREEPAADPSKLLREANAALDAKDFAAYQEKYGDYILARQAADPRFKPAPQQAQAPQVHPMLQVLAGQYADVMSDPDALDWAQAYERRLARQGVPEGPQRWKQSFEEGRRILGTKGKQPAPTFSTKSRDVLSGTPRSGTGTTPAGKGETGVILTPDEQKWARRAKMSDSEYAQHLVAMHPDRAVEA